MGQRRNTLKDLKVHFKSGGSLCFYLTETHTIAGVQTGKSQNICHGWNKHIRCPFLADFQNKTALHKIISLLSINKPGNLQILQFNNCRAATRKLKATSTKCIKIIKCLAMLFQTICDISGLLSLICLPCKQHFDSASGQVGNDLNYFMYCWRVYL